MKSRTILYADEGKILTDGKNFGKQILLAESETGFSFYEILEEEYKEILKKREEEMNKL